MGRHRLVVLLAVIALSGCGAPSPSRDTLSLFVMNQTGGDVIIRVHAAAGVPVEAFLVPASFGVAYGRALTSLPADEGQLSVDIDVLKPDCSSIGTTNTSSGIWITISESYGVSNRFGGGAFVGDTPIQSTATCAQ